MKTTTRLRFHDSRICRTKDDEQNAESNPGPKPIASYSGDYTVVADGAGGWNVYRREDFTADPVTMDGFKRLNEANRSAIADLNRRNRERHGIR